MVDPPKEAMPCWHITDAERLEAKRNNKPYEGYTDSYFVLLNRVDSVFIEGFMGKKSHQYPFLFDTRDRITYLVDFLDRKKVYFTFDRINLYELIEWYPSAPNPIRFILKRIDSARIYKYNQAFMIMPFHNEEIGKLYFSHIKPFLKDKLNIEVYRADDFRSNDIIIDTIYKLIEESEFVVADTTYDNKNSFYELGYAAAVKKEIITIQNKKIQKMFFDRSHIRSILYDLNDIPSFHLDLKSTIESIRGKQ